MYKEDVEDYYIIARVHNFTDETFHIPGKESAVEFTEVTHPFREGFCLSVYANGDSAPTQGYVSLDITSRTVIDHQLRQKCVFTCFVSVIDNDKKERFTRSFSCEREYFFDVSFEIKDYVARKRLVEESSKLLPSDCLTIHVRIIFHNLIRNTINKALKDFILRVREEESNNFVRRLNLDSVVKWRLYEISTFFKDRMNSTSEKDTKILLSLKEIQIFSYLCMIIMGSDYLSFSSVKHLCQLYRLADEYDIIHAVETCRTLIKLYCDVRMKDEAFDKFSTSEGRLMLGMADIRGDDYLKEITDNFMQRNHAYFEERGVEVWKCEITKFPRKSGCFNLEITFERKDHGENFNFYS